MTKQKRSTIFGAAILIFALLFRFGGSLTASVHALRVQDAAKSGWIRYGPGGIVVDKQSPTMPQPPETTQPISVPVFSTSDLADVQIRYATGSQYRPNLETLLSSTLDWDLDSNQPAVLILHTHGSEAYTKTAGQSYTEHIKYRTRNNQYNVVGIGDLLATYLEAAGICVIHDRTLYDDPSYNTAYASARKSIQQYLQEYPSIQLVLDLHRDAAVNPDGSQYATRVTVDGQDMAQFLLVMGTDSSGAVHPNWQENLSVALKLQVLLEQAAPGITRTTVLRASRYNQDLHPAMLLVEVGSAGNTLSQAQAAIAYLAQAIIALKDGANRSV